MVVLTNWAVASVQPFPRPLHSESPEMIPEFVKKAPSQIQHSFSAVRGPEHARDLHSPIDQGLARILDDTGNYGQTMRKIVRIGHSVAVMLEVPTTVTLVGRPYALRESESNTRAIWKG